MAKVKISELPAGSTPLAGTEELPAVQSNTTVKVTVDDLRQGTLNDGSFAGTYAGQVIRTGAGAYGVLKHNLSASASPAVANDSSEDYAVGSVWIDTTNDNIFQCVDATVGAAVWR